MKNGCPILARSLREGGNEAADAWAAMPWTSAVGGNISFGSTGSQAHCAISLPPTLRKKRKGGAPTGFELARSKARRVWQSPCRLHKTLRTSGMQHPTWGLIVYWISSRHLAPRDYGEVSCSMLRSYPLFPNPRGARAGRLVWGWSRCWCWAGVPVCRSSWGGRCTWTRSPSRRCRPVCLKARVLHRGREVAAGGGADRTGRQDGARGGSADAVPGGSPGRFVDGGGRWWLGEGPEGRADGEDEEGQGALGRPTGTAATVPMDATALMGQQEGAEASP